jgi:hypothetical protein
MTDNLMKIEEIRDLIVHSQTPSEAVSAIENKLAADDAALSALIWLAVINQYRLKLNLR